MNSDDELQMSDSFLKEFGIQKDNNNSNKIPKKSPVTSVVNKKELEIGKLFFHYNIIEFLGAGGMGEVYKAMDIKNNREVAIKTLKKNNKKTQERFYREYKFLSSIDHPNLIKAYDFKEKYNKFFMVMEYINGKPLQDLLKEKKDISLVDKLAMAIEIAQGLEALNLAGIIHRDVKPGNIMKSSQGMKILDLGLGKDLEADSATLTSPRQLLGTFAYMAPEQTEGKVTTTTDIFAFGIVLYQLFGNKTISPFYDDNQFKIFMKIATYELPSLVDIVKEDEKIIYQKIDNIVSKCLQKEPKDRPDHMGKVTRSLISIYNVAHLEKWNNMPGNKLEQNKNTIRMMRKDYQDRDVAAAKKTVVNLLVRTKQKSEDLKKQSTEFTINSSKEEIAKIIQEKQQKIQSEKNKHKDNNIFNKVKKWLE